MKRSKTWTVAALLGLVALALLGRRPLDRPVEAADSQDLVARGKYLVAATGCISCHTPHVMGPRGPEPDASRLLAGHPAEAQLPPAPKLEGGWVSATAGTHTAFAGPWGVSYATNLTPDETTGMGAWTEEIFINAMRTGRHWGQSRPILPPMPWQAYAQLSDDDLKAIFAYLRTLSPVQNQVPEAVVAERPSGRPRHPHLRNTSRLRKNPPVWR